jgi:threonine dehydrogenase-like Zn-dependent dehydrogenase
MKAGIYNGVKNITFGEIEKPKIEPGSIIVKNVRSGICGTDLHAYNIKGEDVGILPGNQFGHEMAGIIDEVGEGVSNFKKGTHVFINPCTFDTPTAERSILMCCDMAGAFSEYVKCKKPVKEYNIFELDESLPWDVAALIEPLSVAMNGCLLVNPKKGDKAIVYGSGIIGLCTFACLKYLGVEDIIVAGTTPSRLEKVKQMGGIPCNNKEINVNEFAMELWGTTIGNAGEENNNADITIDCAGYPTSLENIIKCAKVGSRISIISLGTNEEKVTESSLAFKAVTICGSFAYTPEVNRKVIDMITECPENFAPIITSIYGLSEIAKAFEEACDSHKNIKVLIDHSK